MDVCQGLPVGLSDFILGHRRGSPWAWHRCPAEEIVEAHTGSFQGEDPDTDTVELVTMVAAQITSRNPFPPAVQSPLGRPGCQAEQCFKKIFFNVYF